METLDFNALIDKDGDVIDLAVIVGAYKSRVGVNSFFERFTNYSAEEVEQIVDHALTNVVPNPYSAKQADQMRRKIETAFGVLRVEAVHEREGMLLASWIVGLLFCAYAIFRLVSLAHGNTAGGLTVITDVLLLAPLLYTALATLLAFFAWMRHIATCALLAAILFILGAIATLSLPMWALIAAGIMSAAGYSSIRKDKKK